jgi:hypothetical protein
MFIILLIREYKILLRKEEIDEKRDRNEFLRLYI